MRTRLIRPAFFTDARMARLSFATRLVYIGTWTLADDAGYLDWDAVEIRVQLLPHEQPAKGQRVVDTALAELVERARIKVLECGRHAVIPTIPDHRIKGGESLFTIRKRHETRCSVGLRSPTSGYVPDSVSDSDSVSVSTSALARDLKKRPTESFEQWAARVAEPDPKRRVGFGHPEDR